MGLLATHSAPLTDIAIENVIYYYLSADTLCRELKGQLQYAHLHDHIIEVGIWLPWYHLWLFILINKYLIYHIT